MPDVSGKKAQHGNRCGCLPCSTQRVVYYWCHGVHWGARVDVRGLVAHTKMDSPSPAWGSWGEKRS